MLSVCVKVDGTEHPITLQTNRECVCCLIIYSHFSEMVQDLSTGFTSPSVTFGNKAERLLQN